MLYTKSTLVGIVALFIATIAYIPSAAFVLLRKYPAPPGVVHVSINVVSLMSRPLYWLIAITAFALGFSWKATRG
jgi:hypothetical protein